jgi:hypothetical protein
MNIFKKIVLINKVSKALDEAKDLIDNNHQLTEDTKKVIANLKADIEALIVLLPSLKSAYKEIKEILK